jgi:S-adenosylmethionine decarboxylase proenzyme
MSSLGRHLLVELYDCDPDKLNDPKGVEQAMREAASLSGATIVQSVFHMFSPYGVSGVVVVAESHLAVHTWPEYGFAAVDYFSCGPIDCEAAVWHLKDQLGAGRVENREIARGNLVSSGDGRPVLAAALPGAAEGSSR